MKLTFSQKKLIFCNLKEAIFENVCSWSPVRAEHSPLQKCGKSSTQKQPNGGTCIENSNKKALRYLGHPLFYTGCLWIHWRSFSDIPRLQMKRYLNPNKPKINFWHTSKNKNVRFWLGKHLDLNWAPPFIMNCKQGRIQTGAKGAWAPVKFSQICRRIGRGHKFAW